jgi:hypothetical protein
MDYGNILTRAWRITWQHKVLWIFGILAGCSGSNGGNSNFRAQGQAGSGGPNGFPGVERFQDFLESPEGTWAIVAIVVLALLIALAVLVLSTIGRGGLIGGARLADEQGSVTFGDAWGIGVKSFWRLLGLSLLLAVPIILLAVITGVGFAVAGPFGLICLPLLCLAILAFIPLSIVAHFAQFGVVLDGLRVGDAFRKGWEVLKTNLGPIIILGLILIVIGFVAGILIAAPFIAILAPLLIGMIAGSNADSALPGMPFLVAAGLGFLCYLPIALVLSGVLQTWVMSAWMLAYRQFTGRAMTPAAPPAAPVTAA